MYLFFSLADGFSPHPDEEQLLLQLFVILSHGWE